jgi:RNA polymerase sigma factor (sigma-70 family)
MTERKKDADTVLYLMQSAGRFPRLTNEQEIQLGRQVQAMMRMLELPEDERPEAWENIERQGKSAKNRMIEGNLRLVINIAKKYRNMGLPFEDLIQEGSIGLNRGVELFDPERGFKASTYFYSWIKQSITRALENQSRMIRLPAYMKQRTLRLKQITRDIMQQTGKKPSAETLQKAMELNDEQWKLLIFSYTDATSYDVSVSAMESETSLVDIIPSTLETPQESLDAQGESDRLEQLLSEIGEREAQVLRLRYGIGQDRGQSLEKIGQSMGVSKERVRQIESKAMKSVRKVAKRVQITA